MDQKKTAPDGSGEDDRVVAPVSAQWRQSEESASISKSIARGKDAVGAASAAVSGVKSTAAHFVSEAGGQAARLAQDLASNVAGRVGGMAGDLADRGADAAATATAQAKTLTVELEALARRNPLGAIAGAVAVGALLGMLRRRR